MEKFTKPNDRDYYVLDIRYGAEEYTTLSKTCMVCVSDTLIKLSDEAYHLYFIEDNYVQDVWPNLEPDLREIVISGTHPECWNSVFGNEDDYYSNEED